MKKRILFSLVLIIASMSAGYSQLEKGDVYLGARYGGIQLNGYTNRMYGGLELDIMASDKLGVHYTLLFGKKYVHSPLAPFGGLRVGLLIGSSEDSAGKKRIGAGLLFGILTAIIPEGISYNIPVNDKMTVSPYISPLQFEWIKGASQEGGTDSYAGGGVGVKYHLLLSGSKVRLSPYAEYKIHYYRDTHPGISYGVNLAVNLSKK